MNRAVKIVGATALFGGAGFGLYLLARPWLETIGGVDGAPVGTTVDDPVVDASQVDPSAPSATGDMQAYQNGQPISITLISIDGTHYMELNAGQAFLAMQDASGGILKVTSAFRTEAQQQSLLARLGRYSEGGDANPVGFSPHQNGSAVDIDVGAGGTRGIPGSNDAWKFIVANAKSFGFVNDYLLKPGSGEAWHLSFTGGPAALPGPVAGLHGFGFGLMRVRGA